MRARTRGYWLYLIPSLLLFLAVIVVPFLMNVGASFTRWSGVGTPRWIGLDNYTRLLADVRFWESFQHNVGLIVAMAVVPTMIGLVLAAALFDYIGKRFGARTASALRAMYYLPQVLPVAVAGVVWGWMLHPSYGAVNQIFGLDVNWLGDPDLALATVMAIMVWFQLGYPVVIFMAGLQRVDPSYYEAAEIDGASWWRKFWHITIPQIRPEIFVVLLTCTIAALKVFGPIFVLTRGGPGNATMVPSYFSYLNFFQKSNVGYGSAIATVLALIIIVVTFLFLRVQERES
ncbi:N-Acetyl-D-glucosamine ABC transport system, permease protein 1 [[Actinomadura] parvosata subsp. kistnae]|uniref:ABC transporter permease n=2 Tax=Nonomuraea TaxID=83681 RepID=A0A1V0A984_9ACTN|nr:MULTISPECIES: sugar ABC transporter permease [unclassified Nonomuraea]AQZ66729.1 ABC transporter permease [Nonomuraea sp. ATCC 55076]NJP93452.1 sugar ABC transporter permease [Nonomuraea sp. FMUSA5-5]SPL95152.1 N-Acetyl-D-glucosamine ABC transport system, permease protein 1 [Actinomadura parvosata subsp. kistnae]